MDCVKEYKKRRDGRMKAKDGREDDQWITMKGTHVLIDDGGQVSKGPDKLKNVVQSSGGYTPRTRDSNSRRGAGLENRATERNRRSGRGETNSNRLGGFGYIDYLDKSGFGKSGSRQEKPETMEDDMRKQGYKKNAEGRWENTVPKKIRGMEVVGSSEDGDFAITYSSGDLGNKYRVMSRIKAEDGSSSWAKPVPFKTIGEANNYLKKLEDSRRKIGKHPENKGYSYGPGDEKNKKPQAVGDMSYERFPTGFKMGGREHASPDDVKKIRETVSRFMKNAKEGDVYTTGGGVGSAGGTKFKVVRSRGKLGLAWERDGYYLRPVQMSRQNVEKFISNGAKLVK